MNYEPSRASGALGRPDHSDLVLLGEAALAHRIDWAMPHLDEADLNHLPDCEEPVSRAMLRES